MTSKIKCMFSVSCSAVAFTLLFFSLPSFAQTNESAMSFEDAIPTGPSKWASSFFSIASTTADQVDRGSASIGSYNYVSLNRRLNPDSKFSVRLPFLYNTSGFNMYGDYQKQDVVMQDIHVAYSHYDLGYIGDIEISGNLKVYLPNSDYSQEQRTITRIRPELYFLLPIGRFSGLTYVFKPDFYVQSQTAFFDKTVPQRPDGSYVRDPRRTTKRASLEHYLQLDLDMNRWWGIQTKAGFDEDWYHSSEAEGLEGGHSTRAVVGAGVEVRPMRGLKFLLSFENKPLLATTRGDSVEMFRQRDNGFVLMTNASLSNLF